MALLEVERSLLRKEDCNDLPNLSHVSKHLISNNELCPNIQADWAEHL